MDSKSGVREGVVGQEDGRSKHLGHRGLKVKVRPAIKDVWNTERMWRGELKFNLWKGVGAQDSPTPIMSAHG